MQEINEPYGQYSNFLTVGHNAYEFIFDFGQCGLDASHRTHTRIITAPAYAKAFLDIICRSLEQYETEFGVIHIDESA